MISLHCNLFYSIFPISNKPVIIQSLNALLSFFLFSFLHTYIHEHLCYMTSATILIVSYKLNDSSYLYVSTINSCVIIIVTAAAQTIIYTYSLNKNKK